MASALSSIPTLREIPKTVTVCFSEWEEEGASYFLQRLESLSESLAHFTLTLQRQVIYWGLVSVPSYVLPVAPVHASAQQRAWPEQSVLFCRSELQSLPELRVSEAGEMTNLGSKGNICCSVSLFIWGAYAV